MILFARETHFTIITAIIVEENVSFPLALVCLEKSYFNYQEHDSQLVGLFVLFILNIFQGWSQIANLETHAK